MVLNPKITARIKEVLKASPQGLSITDIVNTIKINRNTAGRYLENLLVSGQVEMRHFGMAKIYSLSHRVPVSAVLSISSEHILQLDNSLRVVYANEPFLDFLNTSAKDLFGKNISYSPLVPVFDEVSVTILEKLKSGLSGTEWHGELALHQKGIVFACHIAPMVFNEGTKGVTLILEDITDKKKNEEMVRISEKRLSGLLENLQGMVYRCYNDPDWTMEYISKGCFSLTGYDAAALTGNAVVSYSDLIDPDDREIVKKAVNEGISHDRPFRMTYRIRTSGGKQRWVWEQGRCVSAEPGKPEILEGLIVDITDRKTAEEALRQSEERFRGIFQEGPLGMAVVGPDYRFMQVNRKMCDMFGYMPEELQKKTFIDITHPAYLQTDTEGVIGIYKKTSAVYRAQKEYIRKDGSVIWGSVTVTPLLNSSGEIISTLALVEDITLRKKAADLLRKNEKRYRMLLERSFDAVTIHRDGRVILANQKAAEILGADSPEDLIGTPSIHYISSDRRALVGEKVHTMLKSCGEDAVELFEDQLIRYDGTPVDVEVVATSYLDDDRPTLQIVFKDISRQKNLANALRQSEEQYRTLTEHSQHGVFIAQDNIIRYVNGAFARLLNVSPEEIIGRQVPDFIWPQDRDMVVERGLRRQRGDPVPDTFECRLIRPDSMTPVHVIIDVGVIEYHGRPANTGTVRDITQEKIDKDALTKSEERFRKVFEDGPLGMAILDGEFRFVAVNRKLCELFGYPKEEFLVKKYPDLVHPDHRIENIKDFERYRIAPPGIFHTEKQFLRKDGSVMWGSLTVTHVKDQTGAITSAIALVEDITEKKEMERTLRENEERYRLLAEHSPDIINRQKPDSTLTYVSPAVTTLLGYEPEEVLGHKMFELVFPEDLGSIRDALAEVMSGAGDTSFLVFRFRHKDGRYLWFESKTHAIRNPDTGEVNEFYIVSRDITARKLAEEKKNRDFF